MNELERLISDMLYPKTIGFDWLNTLQSIPKQSSYPPFNIIKNSENNYIISFAVSGFTENDINIEVNDNILTVIGNVKDKDANTVYLHKGIATRQFKQSFILDRFIEVKNASMMNGMLNITLERNVPEKFLPKKIEIQTFKGKQILLE